MVKNETSSNLVITTDIIKHIGLYKWYLNKLFTRNPTFSTQFRIGPPGQNDVNIITGTSLNTAKILTILRK